MRLARSVEFAGEWELPLGPGSPRESPIGALEGAGEKELHCRHALPDRAGSELPVHQREGKDLFRSFFTGMFKDRATATGGVEL